MTDRIKVAHVITGLTFGGAQRLLLHLLCAGKGLWDPMVVGLYPGAMAAQFRAANISVFEFTLNGFVSPATFASLYQAVRAAYPDVIHTHLGKADTYGRLVAGLTRTPCVTTVHNVEDWKASGVFRTVDSLTARWARAVIACSEAVERDLRSRQPSLTPKCTVIRNGIAVEGVEYSARSGLGRVGVVGRLEPQKNHAWALEVWREVVRVRPSSELWIVGDGSLREIITERVRQAGLADSVRLLGAVDNMDSVYEEIDVLFVPSKWEGLPMVVLEAMARGVPVVATPVGGIPEAVLPGVTGELVDVGDTEAAAQAILRLLGDARWRDEVGWAARDRIAQEFDIRHVVRAYDAVYRRVLQ